MKPRWLTPALLAPLLLLVPPAAAADLTVCLEEDSPPYSYKFRSRQGGYDHAVSQALAERLGRHLKVLWFETEIDEENNAVMEANALLSDGRCDLIAGYALIEASLGEPFVPAFRLPDYEGRKRSERGRMVTLGVLAASDPYHSMPMAVILGPDVPAREVKSLRDVADLHIGAEVSTLASAILVSYDNGALRENLVHATPEENVWGMLEDGTVGASLSLLHQFDWYRSRHPDTRLRDSGYRHPLQFNFGFALLQREDALRRRVNEAIAAMRADGTLERLAREAGMTYVAPVEPAIFKHMSRQRLLEG